MEEEKRICSCCGDVLNEDDYGTWVGEDLLCESCVDNECIVCDHCGDTVYSDDSESDDNICLCSDCYNDYYRRCECCNRIIHDNDVNWYNNLPYCNSCYDDLEDEIEDYSYKPEPIFYGDSYLYFGVELEIDNGGKDDNNAGRLKDTANVHDEHIYIKSDGSLDDGFEIVSHPMTLDYHMNTMNWKSVLYEAVRMGYKSHDTSTCGLHIHVNRDAFASSNQLEQEEIISRILFFVEKYWNEIFKFSRRTESNINRWSCRLGMEKSGKEILDKAKDCCNRYVAVNLRNYSTIQGSEKCNYNNHPFYSEKGFALAHNGVLYNDKKLRKKYMLPTKKIETDSYVAVQLLENFGGADMANIRRMSEVVEGSFTFTILKNDNTLFLIKGTNPITVYHFAELGIYVYASTKEILENALKAIGFKYNYKEIRLTDGEILQINPNGTVVKDTFEMAEKFVPHYWNYSCCDDGYDDFESEEKDLLFEYCGMFGVSESDVELLLDFGYTCGEIEDLLMNPTELEEAVNEVKDILKY